MDPDNINRVEAYFRDELSENELKQFREDLADDEDLKQLFQEYHLAMEAVDVQVEDELRDQFNKWKADKRDHKSRQRSIFPQVWKIAASLLLITTVAYLIYRTQANEYTGYELAMEYYELPPSPGGDMGKGEETWANGLQAYEAKDFSKAIALWTNMDDLTPEQQYYLAHAYFNTHEYSLAINLFQQISNGTSAYKISADWFLALGYLASDQKDDFGKQIKKITQTPGHPYATAAEKLSAKVRAIPADPDE